MIREQLRLRHWSKYKLAKETGLSQTTVNSACKETAQPEIATVEVIARAFGMSLSEFFRLAENGTEEKEDALLKYWRALDSKKQEGVLYMLEHLL